METPGSLVDKLIVVHLKGWFLEELCRKPNAEDKDIADAKRKMVKLNEERYDLINEFNYMIYLAPNNARKYHKIWKTSEFDDQFTEDTE